ncbi:MAG TPA: hypothetical protein VGD76_19590 [Ramlibacter sp.]
MQEPSVIQPGDRVVSSSGGPVMNVLARSLNLAYCSWPEGGTTRHGTFTVEGLVRVADLETENPPLPVEPGAST